MADVKKLAAKAGTPTTDTPGATFPGAPRSLVVDDPEASPRERVTDRVRGKPAKSLVEVRAADVVAIAAEIPAKNHTLLTTALRDGAAQAVRESTAPDTVTVYQTARQLAQLLEAAVEPVREGP